MELWELSARESIRELVARYNACGDSGRFDDLMELFWDDAQMELANPPDPQVYRGIDAIRTIFTGTLDRWKSDHDARASEGAVPATPNHVRHCVSTLVIDIDSPEQARGYMYFHVIMPHGLDHWGRYFDRYEARDGEWRFASRRVKREGGIDLLPGDPA